jgi:crotonobetainyl-CoA:carnitine CoA-transferase CaiB-like acyl-CoA transferase
MKMGENTNSSREYSIIEESNKLLRTGILENPLIAKLLPPEAEEYARRIEFTGSHAPIIPVNWRFAESIAVLKGLEGIMINALLRAKYDLEAQDIVINTDHAQLFIMSSLLTSVITEGQQAVDTKGFDTTSIFSNYDIHRASATPYRTCASNIYKANDGRYFYIHSDLNPEVVQDALGMPHDAEGDFEEAPTLYQEKVLQYSSSELDELCAERLRISGTVAWTVDEYKASEHGRANANVGLWELHEHANASQIPCWWPSTPQTSPARPLSGLKVVDFTRIIAGPTLTRGLAELGASVMRITAPHLPDMGFLHPDLGWGKWNTPLDLRDPVSVQKAKELILDADVVVYGYRPSVLDKYGLGEDDVLELCRHRRRGITVARLNCYGWMGPWAGRSGWQQISDACCGVSLAFGRTMLGRDEAVTPVFPNSDHCTGLAGTLGVLSALMARARNGGSYTVDVSLNAYSSWLVNSVGTYPPHVWEDVWALNGRPVFRHYHPMQYLWPAGIRLMKSHAPHMLNPDFFEDRPAKAMNCTVRCLKPVLQFPGKKVQLGFQVGARANGVDMPRWPGNLLTEKVV